MGRGTPRTRGLMKLGLISDIHGNAVALELVLSVLDAEGATKIWSLGDDVGYFADSTQVLATLRARGIPSLLGNHEAMVIGALAEPSPDKAEVYDLARTRTSLAPELPELAARVPFRQERWGAGRALLCHGSPWNPVNGYIYPDGPLARFAALPYDLVFMGHTHRPMNVNIERPFGTPVRVVNVGSTGLPRDDGRFASCALVDTHSGEVEILRVPLPLGEIRARYHIETGPVHECMNRMVPSNMLVGRIVS